MLVVFENIATTNISLYLENDTRWGIHVVTVDANEKFCVVYQMSFSVTLNDSNPDFNGRQLGLFDVET